MRVWRDSEVIRQGRAQGEIDGGVSLSLVGVCTGSYTSASALLVTSQGSGFRRDRSGTYVVTRTTTRYAVRIRIRIRYTLCVHGARGRDGGAGGEHEHECEGAKCE